MKTVLVADDDPANRQLIGEILAPLGYEIKEASDGVDALEKIGKLRPDLVLLDIQMPRLDGFGVLRALRQDARFSALPVIALTALAMAGDREKTLESGFSGYLAKPINIATLRQLVKQWLG